MKKPMEPHHHTNPREQKYTIAEVQGWRNLMKEKGWKQKQLAAHLGLKQNNVSKILTKEAFGELRA
jgi:transcriptional regulator